MAAIAEQGDPLRVLMVDWQFGLPMASAILTVYDPARFSVYDVRSFEILGDARWVKLGNKTWSDKVTAEYRAFVDAVGQLLPGCRLRDADWLAFGKSYRRQLKADLAIGFAPAPNEKAPQE